MVVASGLGREARCACVRHALFEALTCRLPLHGAEEARDSTKRGAMDVSKNAAEKETGSIQRRRKISIRVTPDEYVKLISQRDAAGYKELSVYLRKRALGRAAPPPPVPAMNREAWQHLLHVADNLNQIVHHADARHTLTEEQVTSLTALTEEIRLMRLAVLGVPADIP